MALTWQQTGIALFVAIALHGGIAVWFALPTPEPAPEPPKQTLRVSLSAIIAQTTTPAAVPKPPPVQPKAKPPITPKPVPPIKPKPVAEPVQQQAKPEPIPEPLPIEKPPEPTPELVATPEPIPETAPPAPNTPPQDTIATAKYEQLLVAWLEKHKKYPRRAKRMRIEGEGRLRISINRSGQTQKITLEQRTGNRLLDKTALEMAERANPFPPMPENDPRQTLEFIVPVVFALR